ncbi:hypothetical protein [Elizabethkingia ursingii]|nr:hypothetical protein [Elizabethkingia ursingii]
MKNIFFNYTKLVMKGNIETPQQKLKELDALLKNKLKKDNNILELDLLK